ncbi:MAG: hypothetical protein QF464_08470 [Myxococcota bacterium]|nr:hypothetical protein [Myxococcota bacterium]
MTATRSVLIMVCGEAGGYTSRARSALTVSGGEEAPSKRGGEMNDTNAHTILTGILLLGLMVGAQGCAQDLDPALFEGTWDCKTAWTWDKDGESVPCSYEGQGTCMNKKLTATGVLSVGAAQWNEIIEGTCHVSGQEYHETRTSQVTTARNDSARQFEQERLGGKTLGSTLNDALTSRSSHVTSLTDTRLVVVDGDGRTTTCKRM